MNPQKMITPLSSTVSFTFVLASLLFWFSLNFLMVSFSAVPSCLWKRKEKNTLLLRTKQQPNKVSDQLVNTVEYLAAKEPHISLVETKTRAKRKINID